MFEQFKNSFNDADTVILTNIYASMREEKDESVSSQLLATQIGNTGKNVIFLPELSDMVEYLSKTRYDRNTVVISMGAGDIYKIWTNLL